MVVCAGGPAVLNQQPHCQHPTSEKEKEMPSFPVDPGWRGTEVLANQGLWSALRHAWPQSGVWHTGHSNAIPKRLEIQEESLFGGVFILQGLLKTCQKTRTETGERGQELLLEMCIFQKGLSWHPAWTDFSPEFTQSRDCSEAAKGAVTRLK